MTSIIFILRNRDVQHNSNTVVVVVVVVIIIIIIIIIIPLVSLCFNFLDREPSYETKWTSIGLFIFRIKIYI